MIFSFDLDPTKKDTFWLYTFGYTLQVLNFCFPFPISNAKVSDFTNIPRLCHVRIKNLQIILIKAIQTGRSFVSLLDYVW
jgi:hypothetical protein